MTLPDLKNVDVANLITRFVELGLEQYKVLIFDDGDAYEPLFWEMQAIVKELKNRPGDQRRALIPLYDHPNEQVRLSAARRTLALEPIKARGVIENIAASTCYPQAGDAGMCLWALDKGVFVPD